MEQIYDKALQNKINALIELKKLDISTIARGINKSPAAVSLYLSSKYNAKIDTIQNDLKNYINTFEKSENTEFKTLEFVETTIVKRVFNAANMCQLRGKMGACWGAPGIGKTTAINEYKRTSSGVIVVDPLEQTSARSTLKQIAGQLKLSYSNNDTLDEFISNIIKKVERNKCLIIIDEAENLKIEVFKVIRKIFDRAQNNCGILFVGTEELEALLLKVKSGFPYISSRIGYLEKLDTLKMQDVEKLVIQYFDYADKKLIEEIAKTANFNARGVQNLLDLCLDITKSRNIKLTIEIIEAMRERLLI
ncbi:MAG: ATP-binding protein [Candidatus Gastranaerophilales bacterium]|nr:ATP-binding protein [Candidatus Gastranaerophilales bacterium]